MSRKKSVLATATLVLGLWTGLVSSTLAQSDDTLLFEEPLDLDKPPSMPGGTRAASCAAAAKEGLSLTALMPPKSNNTGVTVSGHPEFFVYVPETTKATVNFVLRDEEWNDVYRKEMEVSGEAKILKFSIPKTDAPLKTGMYSWNLYLVCPPNERGLTSEIEVGGVTERRTMDADLEAKLAQATGRDRVRVYAENGIWHETVSTLVELRSASPDNKDLARDWESLLTSVGLENIASEPATLAATSENP